MSSLPLFAVLQTSVTGIAALLVCPRPCSFGQGSFSCDSVARSGCPPLLYNTPRNHFDISMESLSLDFGTSPDRVACNLAESILPKRATNSNSCLLATLFLAHVNRGQLIVKETNYCVFLGVFMRSKSNYHPKSILQNRPIHQQNNRWINHRVQFLHFMTRRHHELPASPPTNKQPIMRAIIKFISLIECNSFFFLNQSRSARTSMVSSCFVM